MSLQSLELNSSYDSDEDDLIKDFYTPLLSNAVMYKRIASYYSSSSLAVAAEGISNLIKNNGYMKVLINVGLSKEDKEAIEEGLAQPQKVIEDLLINDLDKLKDALVTNRVKALSWLVAKKRMEIKVVVVSDSKEGIFHQKIGIVEDLLGNKISFSGSENETASGLIKNIEEFKVFRYWIPEERKYLQDDEDRFTKFWEGKASRALTLDLPEAVKRELIRIAPSDESELKEVLKIIEEKEKKAKKRELRDYQKTAIQKWIENNQRGIMEMATGTGKTFTAISTIKGVLEKEKSLMVIIACPFQHLVTQWYNDLNKEKYDSIQIFGGKRKWMNALADSVSNLNSGHIKYLIAVTTYDSCLSREFIEIVEGCKKKKYIIGDEVHSAGAEKRSIGLRESYEFRLGLSATPSRWMDDVGTKRIGDYFGKTIFEFGLKEAIDHGFLTPYKYFPHVIYLTPGEVAKYEGFSPKIARFAGKNDSTNQEKFMLMLILRQKIIVNAENKLIELENILKKEEKVDKCLVYCSDKQISKVQDILANRKIIFHRFTSKENKKLRESILKNFENGTYQALVAMKCLDEGVDIPATKTAIILASSGNPKEYIQRRGRVLRLYPGKDYSIIHDLIVLPPKGYFYKSNTHEIEKNILLKEIRRYKEFADISLNPLHGMSVLMKIMDEYKLGVV